MIQRWYEKVPKNVTGFEKVPAKVFKGIYLFIIVHHCVSMLMEKQGQAVWCSPIRRVRRAFRASVLVTTGQRKCHRPVWLPGGHLPYSYIN